MRQKKHGDINRVLPEYQGKMKIMLSKTTYGNPNY